MDKINITSVDLRSFLENRGKLEVDYNKKRDILFMQIKNPPPAISVDCGGIFWIRVNPENKEIVGIEIEGYRKIFLKRHYELERISPSPTKPFVDEISRELAGCLS
jgi:hypothetical protein